ncbi:MAG: hypothetical protein A2339_07780 [Elusimicrobia bacterium RIFOXYB12_FULL_50_12]|nr:MAG: hypothetical protein A2278_02950 [Elusimicrobia bacterium RIFOXYA12_FULL_49_49]OGS10136.1 MAG: hypothetical protein A2386_02900 [Elusimicrobia bacterium RIFOXYB1_FULL_48_9]OGS16440.1 MAG: hypothetical protein A2251_06405 [Elusimicrobia bacterium RIFOXYA2_FULL_47_53]OGS27185.1 MAG: hypothetical protein A2339_07780 [Elusimicrobia bacterium RIFOXYB12_FULL_50_12]OGS30384.1 MAG: hypothetical protein A2323_02640 [Elusimicrobia bacterium RIFOXYB2_FULL_46_23]
MSRILVVDDSKFMRLILKNYFEKDSSARHEVVGEAEDGASAVAKYKELKPDLVTMDIIMPTESGLAAVRDIVLFDSNAKIIMVSAMGQEKVVEEALALGAKGFVTKPVKAEELLLKVKQVLEI